MWHDSSSLWNVKIMNSLDLGECVHTFTNVTTTRKNVIEAGDLVMKLLTDGDDIDD